MQLTVSLCQAANRFFWLIFERFASLHYYLNAQLYSKKISIIYDPNCEGIPLWAVLNFSRTLRLPALLAICCSLFPSWTSNLLHQRFFSLCPDLYPTSCVLDPSILLFPLLIFLWIKGHLFELQINVEVHWVLSIWSITLSFLSEVPPWIWSLIIAIVCSSASNLLFPAGISVAIIKMNF